MATDRRWELLAVLLLMLQPAMGDPDRYHTTYIKNDRGSPKFRHWSTTHPTVIQPLEKITTVKGPTSQGNTTAKPETCPDSGDVVLRLSRIGIRVVGDNVVDSLRVKELHLDDNGITEVFCGAFNKIPRLETLNLSLNNISTNRLLYFGKHERLRRLIVDDNKRRDPDNSELKTFHQSLPNLWELSVKRSFVAVFSVSLTEFAPNLCRLDLSGNEIVSSEFLKNAPQSLKYLDLSDNKIIEIRGGLPNSLLELKVAGNRMKELCAESCDGASMSLQNLTSLKKLNASHNAIATVQVDAFQRLSNLIVLDLSRNEIRDLHAALWQQAWQIQELYLAKNKLTSVPELCGLRNLQRLDLSGNLIASLTDENICQTHHHLQFLFLNDNRILKVNGAAFSKLVALRTLDLSGNELTTVPSNLINSTSLELLFLKRNKIDTLKDLAKEWSPLKELHLQDNLLLFIHTNWIDSYNLPHLQIMLKDRSIENKTEEAKEDKPTNQEEDDDW